jgi:hypothetical protein
MPSKAATPSVRADRLHHVAVAFAHLPAGAVHSGCGAGLDPVVQPAPFCGLATAKTPLSADRAAVCRISLAPAVGLAGACVVEIGQQVG